MKTKIAFTLLAFTAFSFTTVRAEELLVDTDGDGYADSPSKLCGGADDDQIHPPINVTVLPICGGMDDDQIVGGDGADFVRPPVPQGLVGDPLGVASGQPANHPANLYTSIQGPYQIQGVMPQPGGLFTSPQYPYGVIAPASGTPGMTTTGGWTQVAGGNAFAPPVNGGLSSPTLNICGGNGNDSIITGAGVGGGPNLAGNCTFVPLVNGGIAADTLNLAGDASDKLLDRAILQLMTTGSLHGNDGDDTLWGDNEAESFVFGTTSY